MPVDARLEMVVDGFVRGLRQYATRCDLQAKRLSGTKMTWTEVVCMAQAREAVSHSTPGQVAAVREATSVAKYSSVEPQYQRTEGNSAFRGGRSNYGSSYISKPWNGV